MYNFVPYIFLQHAQKKTEIDWKNLHDVSGKNIDGKNWQKLLQRIE